MRPYSTVIGILSVYPQSLLLAEDYLKQRAQKEDSTHFISKKTSNGLMKHVEIQKRPAPPTCNVCEKVAHTKKMRFNT